MTSFETVGGKRSRGSPGEKLISLTSHQSPPVTRLGAPARLEVTRPVDVSSSSGFLGAVGSGSNTWPLKTVFGIACGLVPAGNLRFPLQD